jgi:membrane-bound lytic murein transglycosylase MltF
MAELHSADPNEYLHDYFFTFNDSPTYFILKNQSIKYPNLEVIAQYYPKSEPFISVVERKIEEHKDIFHLDPVVVLGLMNSESGFNPYAVSVAGAAGLMQLIPETAQEMGLKVYEENLDIYHNLRKARKNMRKTFNSAIKAGWQENYERLTELFTQYNLYAKETNSLSQEYKKTLLENKSLDERLDPEKNIGAGVKYLAILAKLNMETSNIASLRNIIAAYNFRGEDAAREWTLPTIREPIKHSNMVFEFYRKFKSLAMESPKIYVE